MIVPSNIDQILMFSHLVSEISILLLVRNLGSIFSIHLSPIPNISSNTANVTYEIDPKSSHFCPLLPPPPQFNPWVYESWTTALAS